MKVKSSVSHIRTIGMKSLPYDQPTIGCALAYRCKTEQLVPAVLLFSSHRRYQYHLRPIHSIDPLTRDGVVSPVHIQLTVLPGQMHSRLVVPRRFRHSERAA